MLLKEHLNGHLEGGLNKQSLTKLRRAKMKKMNREIMVMATEEFTAQNTKFFTYSGSKFKFKKQFDELHATFGQKIKVKTYIEAFAGTLASLFHNFEHVNADRYIINDLNKKVINLYKHIQQNPEELFSIFKSLEDTFQALIPEHLRNKSMVQNEDRDAFKNNSDFFYIAREFFNTIALDIHHAALFIFIMAHCFNGIYDENQSGEYNNGFNWSSKAINKETIYTKIKTLHTFFTTHEVVFESMDAFALVEKYQGSDTFIYLDPPYVGSSLQYKIANKSFKYLQTHIALLEICKQYDYMMYSNNYDETLCQHFQAHTSFERGKVNGTSKLPTKEILALTSHKATHYVAANEATYQPLHLVA